jgi:hypothetical protein
MYLPVQVGAACDGGRETIPGFQRDDVGENISLKNRNYCELTALYWAWKNLDVEYIGLAHYRRHFRGRADGGVLSQEEALRFLNRYDVVLPKRRRYYIEKVYDHYIHAHHAEPLDLSIRLVNECGPAYAAACQRVMNRTWLNLYNMFIMPKALFDEYCAWLFPILERVESDVDTSGWSAYESRVYGFLAERLFNVWIEATGHKTTEVSYRYLEKQNWPKKIASFLGRKIRKNG